MEQIGHYHCHNTNDPEEAYKVYLQENLAIRFSKDEIVIPNIEFKFANTAQQRKIIKEKLTVKLNDKKLPIAPLESQISYKNYMGSEKDIDDAKYLYELLKDKINIKKLNMYLEDLNIPISRA